MGCLSYFLKDYDFLSSSTHTVHNITLYYFLLPNLWIIHPYGWCESQISSLSNGEMALSCTYAARGAVFAATSLCKLDFGVEFPTSAANQSVSRRTEFFFLRGSREFGISSRRKREEFENGIFDSFSLPAKAFSFYIFFYVFLYMLSCSFCLPVEDARTNSRPPNIQISDA